MEYYINNEVITMDLINADGSGTTLTFNIDFDILLRPFINKYKYCNIELISATQGNFGFTNPVNFFVSGLPWVNQSNIGDNSRVLGGYNRQTGVVPTNPDRSLYRIDFVGQIETFSLQNLGRRNFVIELRQILDNAVANIGILGLMTFTFKFYPVYEDYIDVIYNNDNKQRRIEIG